MAEPIGRLLLGREVQARIDALARACTDPEVLRAAVWTGGAPRARMLRYCPDLTQEILSRDR